MYTLFAGHQLLRHTIFQPQQLTFQSAFTLKRALAKLSASTGAAASCVHSHTQHIYTAPQLALSLGRVALGKNLFVILRTTSSENPLSPRETHSHTNKEKKGGGEKKDNSLANTRHLSETLKLLT